MLGYNFDPPLHIERHIISGPDDEDLFVDAEIDIEDGCALVVWARAYDAAGNEITNLDEHIIEELEIEFGRHIQRTGRLPVAEFYLGTMR